MTISKNNNNKNKINKNKIINKSNNKKRIKKKRNLNQKQMFLKNKKIHWIVFQQQNLIFLILKP